MQGNGDVLITQMSEEQVALPEGYGSLEPLPAEERSPLLVYERCCRRLQCRQNSAVWGELKRYEANQYGFSLKLENVLLGRKGCLAFFDTLRHNAMKDLKALCMRDCGLTSADACAVTEVAVTHQGIVGLDLSQNSFGKLTSTVFLKLLQENPRITRLSISAMEEFIDERYQPRLRAQLTENKQRVSEVLRAKHEARLMRASFRRLFNLHYDKPHHIRVTTSAVSDCVRRAVHGGINAGLAGYFGDRTGLRQ